MNARELLKWLRDQWVRLTTRSTRSSGWLGEGVRAKIRNAKKKSDVQPWRARIRRIAVPGLAALEAIIFLFAASLIASFLLSKWNPKALSIGEIGDLRTAFTAMWQVQAGVAAVALPILLFAIELSRDDRQIVLRTHEVLIRETWIFPIIAFSIAGTVKIGCDLSWFGREAVFLIDLFLIFHLTLIFTLFAYYQALMLLFNPAKLKSRSMKVAREKMEESLDSSIELRLANNLLLEKLEGLKVGALLTPPGYPGPQFTTLKASKLGRITDINLDRLEAFIKGLPWKYSHHSFRLTDLDLAIQEPITPPHLSGTRVWFLVTYQQILTRQDNSLVCLQRDAFDEAFLGEAGLESLLMSVVKIRYTDED
jgi:hypothetical protein